MSQSNVSSSQYDASQYTESLIDPELLQSDDFPDISIVLSDFSLLPQTIVLLSHWNVLVKLFANIIFSITTPQGIQTWRHLEEILWNSS
jgi:hypothetical protein